MKKAVTNIFNSYSHIINFFKKESWFGIRNAFWVIIISPICGGILANILPQYKSFFFYLIILILLSIIGLFSIDSNRTHIKIFTRGDFTTTHEFLKEFSHRSFLYCLFVYSFIVSNWIFLLKLIVCTALKLEFISNLVTDFLVVFIIVSFGFSFLYFCYHIYYKLSQIGFDAIKARLQLYAAIISTVTFLLWCLGLDSYFKLFLSGLALVFSWLQYVLYIENNKQKEN